MDIKKTLEVSVMKKFFLILALAFLFVPLSNNSLNIDNNYPNSVRLQTEFSILNFELPLMDFTISDSQTIYAHGGGLNSCGCHFNRKTNTCHCHRNRGCGCECQPSSCN